MTSDQLHSIADAASNYETSPISGHRRALLDAMDIAGITWNQVVIVGDWAYTLTTGRGIGMFRVMGITPTTVETAKGI